MNKQKIIDVSEWQGKINWDKVKKTGFHVILRLGYTGTYNVVLDKRFLQNMHECERLKIPYGVYVYSYAHSSETAIRDAKCVIEILKGKTLSYPVYYDVEEQFLYGDLAKTVTTAFCTEIEKAGYWAGIYSSQYWWDTVLRYQTKYTKWVAKWSTTPPSTPCGIWQYSSVGNVPGIMGNVDLNYQMQDLPSLICTKNGKEEDDYLTQFARHVLKGEYGVGEQRKENIYRAVQNKVNELC